jgi:hypothetical protein
MLVHARRKLTLEFKSLPVGRAIIIDVYDGVTALV